MQKPHPPILVGGSSPGTLRRVLDNGDGWTSQRRSDPGLIEGQILQLRRQAAERGVPPPPVTIFGARLDAVLRALDRIAKLIADRAVSS